MRKQQSEDCPASHIMVYWSCLVTYNVFFFFFKTLDLSSTQGGFCLPIIIFSVFGSVTDVRVPQAFFFLHVVFWDY